MFTSCPIASVTHRQIAAPAIPPSAASSSARLALLPSAVSPCTSASRLATRQMSISEITPCRLPSEPLLTVNSPFYKEPCERVEGIWNGVSVDLVGANPCLTRSFPTAPTATRLISSAAAAQPINLQQRTCLRTGRHSRSVPIREIPAPPSLLVAGVLMMPPSRASSAR